MANPTWVLEVRPPGAGGAWTPITAFSHTHLRKEINTLWWMTFSAFDPGPYNPPLFYNMETLTASGLMADLSVNGNAGAISGSTSVAGKYGNARQFASTSDFIKCANPVGLPSSAITVSCWVNLITAPAAATFFNVVDQSWATNGWNIFIDQLPLIYVGIGDNAGGQHILAHSITAGSGWHHVVLSWDGTVLSMYFDGAFVSSTSIGGVTLNTTAPLFVGNNSGGTAGVDEVYVFNRALSASEITRLFNNAPGALLVNGNEVRWRDSANAKEWFRGRIKDAQINTLTREWQIKVIDNLTLVADRSWVGRRSFPAVPANVIMDETINSNQGQPQNGQQLYLDMETLTPGGLLADLSVNGNNGTFSGPPPTSVTGKWGLARSFTAIAMTVSGSLSVSGDRTVSAWVNIPTSIVSSSLGVLQFNFQNNGGGIEVDATGAFRMSWANGGTTQASAPVTFTTNAWHLLTWTWAAATTTVTFYLDGVSQGTTSAFGVSVNWTGYTIGGINALFASLLPGSIDEVYVYNRILTATEISSLLGTGVLVGGVGTVNPFTAVAFQASSDSRLSIVDALARAVGAEYFVDRNGSDQDRINLVSQMGASLTATFRIGAQSTPSGQQLNTDLIWNDVTVFGQGDGSSQLTSRNFYATTLRTTLSAQALAGDTTLTVVSTTGFPTAGVLYCGMERIKYTGTTATTFTGCTRAYTGDGCPSYSAYQHASGIEVYLHTDNTIFYRPEAPQIGSSIAVNGWKQGTYPDKAYNDQNAMDRLAQRIAARYSTIRESLSIAVIQATVACDLGDTVTLNDYNGTAYLNSPYRIIAYEYDYDTVQWTLELANYRDSFDRRVSAATTVQQRSDTYTQNYAQVPTSTYTTPDATITTTTELAASASTASGFKQGQKVAILAFCSVFPGTGATEIDIKVRRGNSISGLQVGEAGATQVVAGKNYQVAIMVSDVLPADAQQYVVTIQQVGATANGTLQNSFILVIQSS